MHLASNESSQDTAQEQTSVKKADSSTKHEKNRRQALLSKARAAVTSHRAELSPTQPSWWLAFAMLVSRRVKEQQLPQVASSLTFTTVLSLVPMVTVALAIFTAFPMFKELRGDVEGYLLQGFFPEALSGTILTYINEFTAKAKGLTAVGTVALGVTSLMTMFTVDRVFNQIWHVKRPRSLVNKILLYWAVLSMAPILIGLSISATTALVQFSVQGVGANLGFLPLLSILPVFLTVAAFALIYQLIPNRSVRWSDAIAGGLVAAVLFELSKRGFAAYITHFPSYTAVYGAMAAIPLFLLWIYLSWIIVLLGAATVAALPVARTGIWSTQEQPGERWVQGLRVLGVLDDSRYSDSPGLTLEELRVLTQISPDQLDDILTILMEHGLVGLLSGSKSRERFVLVCNPESVKTELVARALWFDSGLNTQLEENLPPSGAKMAELSKKYFANTKLNDWLSGKGFDAGH
ncbi:MAG: YihY family inner membrane protein [Limnobacter sp.]|nr:YihY family inner membrane protein [Limnobacter sp.]